MNVRPIAHRPGGFAEFVTAHLNSFFLPVARRYAGFRGLPDEAASHIAREALRRTWLVWNAALASAHCERRRAFVCLTMSQVACEAEAPTPADGMGDRCLACAASRAVACALAALPDVERLVVDLAIAGISRGEIAAQLGLRSATTVTARLQRARARLLAELDLRSDRNPSGGAA